jgi:hypothetical protein
MTATILRILRSLVPTMGTINADVEPTVLLRTSRPLFCGTMSLQLTRRHQQGKFGLDKKFPTLSLVNDLLFVVAFFFARIVGGSRDVSYRGPIILRSDHAH